jgi:phosphate transport system substrate-binding protein
MKSARFARVAAIGSLAFTIAFAPSAVAGETLSGAGASSINAFWDLCRTSYQTDSGDVFPYVGTGSGDGKKAIAAGTVDIAFSDSVNTATDKPASMIHIPAVAWPVAVMYKWAAENPKPITLSTETIAKIFARQITRWNDKAIVTDLNKSYQVPVYKKSKGVVVLDKDGAPVVSSYRTVTNKVTPPNAPITVVYRASTSGTTNNFVTALNKMHPTIWTKPGNDSFETAFPGTVSADPAGLRSGKGSEGVGQLAKDLRYTITYNEIRFAEVYKLGVANIINPAGKAITPSTEGVLAAFSAATVNEDSGVVTFDYNSKLASQYPFTATTYAMVIKDLATVKSPAKAKAVKNLIEYMAFKCPVSFPQAGMAAITKTSDLGKVIISKVASIKE